MSTYTLNHPVQFGSETISELVLKPTAAAFRGFSQKAGQDGTVVFSPYDAAAVAVRMAGKPNAVVDLLHPEDMMALAEVALGFLASGPRTGSAPSP